MNNLQIFNNFQFGEIRSIEIDGKTYFVASDIATVLGYQNSRKAIADHCRCVTKCDIPHPQSTTKTIEVNAIPESDIYRLIANSQLPSAVEFEKWIFEEVLPSIHKTGSYSIKPLTELETLQIVINKMVEQERALKQIQETQQQALTELNALPEPNTVPEQITTRTRIRQIVGMYVKKTLVSFEDAWNTLYKEFDYRYHKNIKLRAENKGTKPLDIVENDLNLIEELYAVACELFR